MLVYKEGKMTNLDVKQEYFTYADYANWESRDERFELIDGILQTMIAPSERHQEISMKLSIRFGVHLEGRHCRVLAAPFAVRLNYKTRDDTVVQPDLVVICGPKKPSDGKSHKGAPDIVIEILSRSTQKYDKTIKREKYLEAGVAELWYIDYLNETIEINKLKDNNFETTLYFDDDKITTDILPEFELDVADVFAV